MSLVPQDNGANVHDPCLELIKPRAQLFAAWQRGITGSRSQVAAHILGADLPTGELVGHVAQIFWQLVQGYLVLHQLPIGT